MTTTDDKRDEDEGDDLPHSMVPKALFEAAGVESLDEVEPAKLEKQPLRTATGRRVVKR